MQLSNIYPREELRGYLRIAAKNHEQMSVSPGDVAKHVGAGWAVVRQGATRIRLTRAKQLKDAFPDRILTLLYKMGFTNLSGKGGAKLDCKTPNGTVANQIDVVAIDNDVALYLEARTSSSLRSVPSFAEDVAHLDGLRRCFATAVRARIGDRKVGAIYWGYNKKLSDNDHARAEAKKVCIFNEAELEYYEALVSQIGSAARFQFLADVFGSSTVNSLTLQVPAIRIRLGDSQCYSFAISPDKLLKIAYVSHRAKGTATDVDTYQRLLKRSRIREIRNYVTAGGYFPTNIVLSIRARRPLRFDKAATPPGVDASVGNIGWLTLPAEYKSAWVIDGQHRLFAYADAEHHHSAELTVLAFENLPESDQARLFIEINAKQKSVKQNLLVELFAELHWNSTSIVDRISAIISKAILTLDLDPGSPFYNKIIRADDSAASNRSISLKAFSNALNSADLFVEESKAGAIPGAFWQKEQMATLRRTVGVLNFWFNAILKPVRENWDLGKAPGGALGMNDSLVANVVLLRSIIAHLTNDGYKIWDLSTAELQDVLKPWASSVAAIYRDFEAKDFSFFRSLRGIQGQTQRYRELQMRLRSVRPEFNPPGLDEYARSRNQQTINEARSLVDEIEQMLQTNIVGTLKAIYGEDDKGWWFQGVPKNIRGRIIAQLNEEASDAKKESRFNFIDYRAIVLDQWKYFYETLGQDKANASKEKRTSWMNRINEIRNRVSHASKGDTATEDDVQFLRSQRDWLEQRMTISLSDGDSAITVDDEAV